MTAGAAPAWRVAGRVAGAVGASTARRLLRQRLVRRALVWPGALTVGALLLTLALAPKAEEPVGGGLAVAVAPDADAALVEALAAEGLSVRPGEDPQLFAQADGDWVITDPAAPWAGPAEVALRRSQPELPWTWGPTTAAEAPSPARRLPDPGALLAVQISLLYALYGVVLGAAATVRDRQSGVLEAQLVTGVPRWPVGLGRVLAQVLVLALALATTLLLLAAFLALPQLGAWVVHGALGTGLAVALGSWRAAVATREGLSAPLSQGLTAVTGLVVLGFGSPALGGWLPLASLGALGRGEPVAAPLLAGLLSLGGVALATRALAHSRGR